MEQPESSSPYSQAPATCPYPEPTASSPHNPFPLPDWLQNLKYFKLNDQPLKVRYLHSVLSAAPDTAFCLQPVSFRTRDEISQPGPKFLT